jgi:hypothetical protein
VHVRAEAGEINKAEYILSNGSAWLLKEKQKTKNPHKLSLKTTLKHNGIEA